MSTKAEYQDIADFLHALIDADDIDAQWRTFCARVGDLGFDSSIYAFLPATSPKSTYDDLIWSPWR